MPAATKPRGIETEWVNVTPKMAAEWLGKFNNDNRSIRRLVVARYRHDMETGQFPVTHQGIAFADDGSLIDGQHRLMAIRDSGKAMWLIVSRGHPKEIQQFLDRGSRRKPSDFLDGKHARVRVAAVRVLLSIKLLDGKITPADLETAMGLITDADILAALGSDESLSEDLLELSTPSARAANQCILTATGLLVAAVTYPSIAERTLLKIETGAGLDIGDPILALRNHSENKNVHKPSANAYHSLRIFEAVERGRVWKRMQIDRVVGEITVPIRID